MLGERAAAVVLPYLQPLLAGCGLSSIRHGMFTRDDVRIPVSIHISHIEVIHRELRDHQVTLPRIALWVGGLFKPIATGVWHMAGIAFLACDQVQAAVAVQVGQLITICVCGLAYIETSPIAAAVTGILPSAHHAAPPPHIARAGDFVFALDAVAAGDVNEAVAIDIPGRVSPAF